MKRQIFYGREVVWDTHLQTLLLDEGDEKEGNAYIASLVDSWCLGWCTYQLLHGQPCFDVRWFLNRLSCVVHCSTVSG